MVGGGNSTLVIGMLGYAQDFARLLRQLLHHRVVKPFGPVVRQRVIATLKKRQLRQRPLRQSKGRQIKRMPALTKASLKTGLFEPLLKQLRIYACSFHAGAKAGFVNFAAMHLFKLIHNMGLL